MRTLVISDLHLGSRVGRDVLRRPEPLARLLAALDGIERLVLLGDAVELLEGRPRRAMEDAEPVFRAIGKALGPGTQVVLVPGNHDHPLVRPWLRELRAAGKPLRTTARVPLRTNPDLQAISRWLKPARLQVRYPGADLGDGVWAHHGHYLDRHLVRRPEIEASATPDDYERALGRSIADLAGSIPPGVLLPLQQAGRLVRAAGIAARPFVAGLPGAEVLAPWSSAALGLQFRRVGLPAMNAVTARLGVPARDVLFGHVHRAGPLDGDDPTEWDGGDRRLWNTGSWVYEPLLLTGTTPPHPYWPGGALLVEGGRVARLGLLDDVPAEALAAPPKSERSSST